MSRCLPFPPPNYMKNGIGGEALLQQLELRRVKHSKEKEEEKKHKKKDKSEEDDKKLRSHEKKRRNDDIESEKDDDSKRSDEKKKERRRKKEQKHDVEKMETHLEYTNLTMNWVPLEMQMVLTDLEHEDWLSRKNHSNGESERKTADQTEHVGYSGHTDNGRCQGIQPFATYLPNADVYALPYVLPF